MDSKTKGYIISALRRIWRWSKERRDVLNESKRKTKFNCASCKKQFARNEIIVDHITPVISTSKSFEGWDTYINRMFCNKANLQVLCKVCHTRKNNKERQERKGIKNVRT